MADKITYEPITFKRISLDDNTVDTNTNTKTRTKRTAGSKRRDTVLLADYVSVPENMAKRRKTLKYIRNTAVVAAVAFTILFRYIAVMDNTNNISELKSKLADLNEDNINIQCEIDSKTDSDSIEAAAEKLGMAQPGKSQKITVDIKSDDYVEVSEAEDKKESVAPSQFYATMIETLGNIQEYLY